MNFGEKVDMTGKSNDRASVCDGYINPRYAEVEGTPGYEGYNCTGLEPRGPPGTGTTASVPTRGVLFGTALGYRVRDSRFRLELEYFYRDTGYDDTADVYSASGGKRRQARAGAGEARLTASAASPRTTCSRTCTWISRPAASSPRTSAWASVSALPKRSTAACGQETTMPPGSRPGKGLPNAAQIRENLAGNLQSCRHGAGRYAVRLPAAVRGGLRTDRLAAAGGQGPLGRL